MPESTSAASRQKREIEHGARIAARAERVWGWATTVGRRRAERRALLLREAARLEPDHRVIELGCGTGTFTRLLSETHAHIVGIDVSWELLQRFPRPLPTTCQLVRADAERLPFRSSSIDAIVGSSVLHHVSLGVTLAEIRRVLRDGGRLAFAEPNMLNPQVLVQKNVPPIKRLLGDSPDETAFFRWRVRRALKFHGFVDVSVVPHDFLHPFVAARLIEHAQRLGQALERLPLLRELAGSLLLSARKP